MSNRTGCKSVAKEECEEKCEQKVNAPKDEVKACACEKAEVKEAKACDKAEEAKPAKKCAAKKTCAKKAEPKAEEKEEVKACACEKAEVKEVKACDKAEEAKPAKKCAAKKTCAKKAEPKAEEKEEVKACACEKDEVKEAKACDKAEEAKPAKKCAAKKTCAKKAEPKAEEKEEVKACACEKAEVKEEKPCKCEKEVKAENACECKAEEKPAKKTCKKAVEPKVEVQEQVAQEPYKKKILFVASEAAPFIRTGGLGDVAGALPKQLNSIGTDTRVILPLYFDIPESYRQTMKYLGNVYVSVAWRYQYCGVFQIVYEGVTYYFLDNEQYFKRSGIYGHYDDAERFAFFSRAVLESMRVTNFYPDVIHANDWHSALVPVYLDAMYRDIPEYRSIKTVFTIHNIEFQGKYGTEILDDVIGLPSNRDELLMYGDCVNFMKGAIECSNIVTTVSPTYAWEIRDRYYAYGLDMILNQRSYKLHGVVNGIDTDLYNPATDRALFKNYTYENIQDKKANKEALLKMFGMWYAPELDTPLIGMVTRLTEQKGLDLLIARLDTIMQQDNIQMIILGKGDWKYENKLQEIESRYQGKIKVIINFSTDVANKIYAGADMFLMPSKFEPCGLSQMIAMRYGTIPIVRKTGGLNDTVEAFNPDGLTGDGFNFCSYNADDMLDAIRRAAGTFHAKREWNALVANAMSKDFSWKCSAEQYLDLYNKL